MLRISVLLATFLVACTTTVVAPTETPNSAPLPTAAPETLLPLNSLQDITPAPTISTIILPTVTRPDNLVENPNYDGNNPDEGRYATITPEPTIIPQQSIPLSPELTQGIHALISCRGNTEEYWLEHGPPEMTDELVECINNFLEAN